MKISCYYIALISVLLLGCKEEKKEVYSFKGEIEGAAEGTKVFLKIVNDDLMTTVFNAGNVADSTVIKDGKFEFSGKMPEAKLFLLVINSKTEPEEPGMPVYQPSVPVFLENSEIDLKAVLDSIPLANRLFSEGRYSFKNVAITGSKSQDVYLSYLDGLQLFGEKASALFDDEYLPYLNPEKASKKGPISTGVAIVTKIEENQEKRHNYVLKFINENINNPVGLTIAKNELTKLSLEELKKLESVIPVEQKNTDVGKNLISRISEVKTVAPGASYMDLSFNDSTGKSVKLSDYAGKGNYLLLEFWASWCHPCRADIPHLKEVYERYHPKGFEVISVSMDQDKQAWLDAVNEENMPWIQVSDLQAFDGELAKKYQLRAIPTCILLDPKGKIVTTNMRGSFMDKNLIELYGNQFGKTY
ncbi:TlpA disulfide reductase family protein [Flavobacterium agrisoli]|uniref:AhpC/TSA family protein n=1 Tax=Flavobacterium agrisoli TaxID=2793066 RepID=A0A934PIG9_9FLAO|nr:TlpA disulfide reductase family protein [Flavobacterium agrisoli]MBK0368697.1 AhpC/TSA family protein [Flavobacterium agrisoli]